MANRHPWWWLPESIQGPVFIAVLILTLAVLLDAVENYALISLLLRFQEPFLPVLAIWCAIPKFLIVLPGIAYVVLGGPGATVVRLICQTDR